MFFIIFGLLVIASSFIKDYLLSVAESSATSVSSKRPNNNDPLHAEQLDSACFELDNLNLHENQRYCWPVRPLPRRISPNRDYTGDIQSSIASSNISNIHPINYSNTSASGISSQAIGVVIPTTPNSTLHEDNYVPISHRPQQHYQLNASAANFNSIANLQQQQQHLHHHHHQSDINQTLTNLDSELTWEQRLNFIQYFLSLTSKNLNKEEKQTVNSTENVTSSGVGDTSETMVNESKSELYINSASLEDVEHPEANDTRAQSVTSIHSASIPNTPTYEELQAKLEASTRNIQSIKEQQNQLLRLQQAAKDHLVEMENIRNQSTRPAFFNQNGQAPPNYESVGQVQSDMANLVNRMKNLTTFIQGQHELSSLLGDDGPEILAEQEALQNKLIELQQQKIDMQNLVTELQEINTNAENAVKQRRQDTNEVPRVVPVEYQRIVPIELVGAAKNIVSGTGSSNGHDVLTNGHCNGDADHDISNDDNPSASISQDEEAELTGEAADLIKQKMADIATMKTQLKRLKDMMDTVKLIEEKTDGRSIQEIAEEAENLLASAVRDESVSKEKSPSARVSAQRECASREHIAAETEGAASNEGNEAEVSEKVRLLNEMTQDLRSQAANLANERDRLKALRDEMIRRKEADNLEAVAAAKRIHASQGAKQSDEQQIKDEYEAKKNEFEKLCERLHSDSEVVPDEADEAHHEENIEKHSSNTNASYYHDNWQRQNMVSSNSSVRGDVSVTKQSTVPPTPSRGKDSADSGAADVHGIASFEAGSMQSGSSRSFSMPPPMRTINTRETGWRKNSQDNSQSQFDIYAPMPPPLPTWNSSYYYSTPYGQHFNFNPHSMNPSNPDYFCSHNCHPPNAMGQAVPPVGIPTPQQTGQPTPLNTSDPVLLQQFIQTQQMLINSVCQCNQLLWHQQREINNLNNAVMLLQERLFNSSTGECSTQKTTRAESVPPPGVGLSSNTYNAHRAQSEQPHQYQSVPQSLPSPARHHHFHGYNYVSNYQRRNMNSIHQQSSNAAAYNYSSSDQHPSGVCSQLPPIAPQPPMNHQIDYNNTQHSPQTSNYLNNDVPHTANIHQQHPATQPIYMHHHNNTITPDVGTVGTNLQQQQGPPSVPPPHHHSTNNHSNLLTSQQQNCLNSPSTANAAQTAVTSSAVTHGPNNSNNAATASALNNQVPPGNRANNYWDNFRSYSRQNLLSTNSCKSNEEQQQQQQQQQQHQQQQQQQINASALPMNIISNTNLNGFRNLHNAMNALNAISTGNLASYSNNLTPPTFDNKHVHTFRNHLNSNLFNEHESQTPINLTSSQSANAVVHPMQSSQADYALNTAQHGPHNRSSAASILINQGTQSDNLNLNSSSEMHNYGSNNNINTNNNASANVAAIFGSSDFRNMNFNFGANELRKKISIKSASSTKRIRHSQSMTNEIARSNRGSNSSQISSSGLDDGISVARINQPGCGSSVVSSRNIYMDFEDQQHMGGEFNDDDNANADNSNASGYSESSEENKKNLLVNALRNDKFTSKFFERLKEDVYREVYSILQATESQPQYLEQLYKELQLVPTNDPIRNIVMQAMHDIYKHSSTADNELNENYTNNFSDVAGFSSVDPGNNSPAVHSESNQENELMNTLLNSTELRRLAYKIMFDSERSSSPVEKVGVKPNLSSSSTSSSPKPPTEIYRPDYDLVNHIMAIIRNSIQTERIDDEAIMKITKLTISTLERISSTLGSNTLQIDRLMISPKELYRRMRAFDRRDREGFLARYESFLQTMFVMKIVNEDSNNLNLITMKKAPSSNANLLTNSFMSNSSEPQNLRRHGLAGKSNISNTFEVSSSRRVERNHGDMASGGQIEVCNASTSQVRSQQEDHKHQPHAVQKIPPKTRRSKSNTAPSQPTLNQLLFSVNSNAVTDAADHNEAVSSPTINSNNITNEDLAEADQVCSSSTNATAGCDVASGPSIKMFRNDQNYHHQPFRQDIPNATMHSELHHAETDSTKNGDWSRKEILEGAMNLSSKQEAEAECFEGVDQSEQNNAVDDSIDDLDNVTSSSSVAGAAGNNVQAEPIMYDAACAVIYPSVTSSVNALSSESADRPSNPNNAKAALPSTSTLPNAGNYSSTIDGKPKNGVP